MTYYCAKENNRSGIEAQELGVQSREKLRNAQAFDLSLVNSLFHGENVQRAYGLDSKVCY